MSRPEKAYDVVVAGGGPAGVAAAVAAARNGARTLLVERSAALGGMMTSGMVSMIRTAGDNGGVARELRDRLEADASAWLTETHAWVNPCAARVVALEMVLEAGVDVAFWSLVCAVEMDGRRLAAAAIADKQGQRRVSAKAFVDATGDGDLAALAGAAFDKGGDAGQLQAVSLNFQIAGVDTERKPSVEELRAACDDALAKGELEFPAHIRSTGLGSPRPGYPRDILHFQTDLAMGVDSCDADSLSAGEALCQRRVMMMWRFLRKRFAAYRDSQIVSMASMLGLREGRRVRGVQTVTEDDVLKARKFPDAVSRCSWYMDLHDGQNKQPIEAYRAARRPPPGDWYEIPYGCLVPVEVDGLLASGRCVSSTRPANGSLRLQPTCMNLGQAAGVAAALCARQGRQPRNLDGVALRALLKEQGMEL
ncbi:MAG TPA: FAD-dependent oxidoreductase [Candidatus Brocadiia bacterium]|nr:FAD-dependent oxidoreductase [Candidatus Brocadiia bacterium]